ncbi:hydrophobic protein [Streptomyces sp. NPDC056527]|uniref:hydrophobic protein n=1 Tax=Streptomyces sp. NPDC056527 TaxID=3345853 RepID=UPI0036B84C31
MIPLLLVLLVILVLFGIGFTAHVLWYIAIAVLVLWLLGFFLRADSGQRWYRW